MTSVPSADRQAEHSRDVIAVDHLSLDYRSGESRVRALVEVCLQVRRGEIFGLVGESGSGKTTLALQLLGYRDARAERVVGRVVFDEMELTGLDVHALEKIRGRRISYVPQSPATALNPGRRVGEAIAEVLRVHRCATTEAAERNRTLELLTAVGLPQPHAIARRFPHQLSGGQQQRVVIAVALACRPDLIVLDEPTTGLDVTTQRQILRLLSDLRVRLATSMLYVTHDLGVIEELADRVGVMYAGSIVEIATTRAIFAKPLHPYTARLIASVPRLGTPVDPSQILRGSLRREEIGGGCPFQPRCPHAVPACRDEAQTLCDAGDGQSVACREWERIALREATTRSDGKSVLHHSPADPSPLLQLEEVSIRYGMRGRIADLLRGNLPPVVRGVSFSVARGEVFALVGESGSGKSTIARAISGLLPLASGTIAFDGTPLPPLVHQRSHALRQRIQFVFQNPDASLNPRRTIAESLARPLALFHSRVGSEACRGIALALEEVQLPASYATRYPDELSGGERQRIAIARALLAKPELMLCDEVLSALDVSVQASILDLLKRLRRDTGVAMIFIAHDLAVVEQIADRVGVLYGGQLLESGAVADVFAPPHHPYTLSLLTAAPGGHGEMQPPAQPGTSPSTNGCSFAGRCPVQLAETCCNEPPPWQRAAEDKHFRCHIAPARLEAQRAPPPGAAERASAASAR